MVQDTVTFDLLIDGGWATDFGPNFGRVDGLTVRMPWLVDAENCIFLLDGGTQKIPGAAKLNSSAITGAGAVTGIFDYWRQGTSGTPVQKRVAHSGTIIVKEDLDGTFDTIKTGLESGKIPSYAVALDLLIISSNSNSDVPFSWDQTTFQNLAGTPPNFAFGVWHKNHFWAAGVASNPSRLYYSKTNDPEDWTDDSAGSIDIETDDGDGITGLASHNNELIIFKGPNKGAVHRITGSSEPDFARKTVATGIGSINHNGIQRFGNDLAFMGINGKIHSFSATEKFGDYSQAFLSQPIDTYIRESLNPGRFEFTQAADCSHFGILLFTVTGSGQSTNDRILMMDYRFAPPRWGLWTAPDSASLAVVKDIAGQFRCYHGTYDGFVLKGDQADRTWVDTAIAFKNTTPFLNFQVSEKRKMFNSALVGISPKGDYNMTFQWQRDGETAQTETISQAGGDVLGTATANQFTLGTSTLAGGRFIKRPVTTGSGEFQDIQLQVTQAGDLEDAELHSLAVTLNNSAFAMD